MIGLLISSSGANTPTMAPQPRLGGVERLRMHSNAKDHVRGTVSLTTPFASSSDS
jgi:hypothetical protein